MVFAEFFVITFTASRHQKINLLMPTTLVFAPFSHMAGMGAALFGLSDGNLVIFMPRFDFGDFIKIIAEKGV